MQHFKHFLDLSYYPTSHPLFDPTNKNSFNNELNGAILEESVIVRSKMYSIEFAGGVKQSAKPVQKVLKKSLHQKYLDVFKEVSAAARQ